MKKILFILSLLMILTTSAYAGKPDGDQKSFEVTLSCFGYGYQVKTLINGKDIGIKGGKSEGKRLFSQDHPFMKEAPPELRKKLFVLKDGENRIQIEFKKTGNASDELTMEIMMEGYPDKLFFLKTKLKPQGKIEKTIIIRKSMPKGFKTVSITY